MTALPLSYNFVIVHLLSLDSRKQMPIHWQTSYCHIFYLISYRSNNITGEDQT